MYDEPVMFEGPCMTDDAADLVSKVGLHWCELKSLWSLNYS